LIAALTATLVLWLSVPFLRPVSNWLRDQGVLRATMALGGLAMLWAAWRFRPKRLGVAAALAAAYVGLFLFAVVMPEERFHFLVMPVIASLWLRVFQHQSRAAWRAWLVASLVGLVEEAIQVITPGRYFDWRDVAMASVAAGLAIAYLSPRRASGQPPA